MYKGVQFIDTFRDYQARVLSQMDQLMIDGRLHISAAPGAGKTVLGLEAIRRLGNRALILVPTINLRNQWKERFLGLFISAGNAELRNYWNENFSTDIKNPGIITCTTYQALYSIYSKTVKESDASAESESGPGFEEMIDMYKRIGVGTICLDEAHHLKREWWKALTEFLGKMNSKLIALTATPPMDTSDLEWRRYIGLCGEIDLEISIPEMVVKKCLCPHQDFLYLCKPSELEEKKVEQELQRNKASEQEILRNIRLYNEIKQLAVLTSPNENRDFILKNPDYMGRLIKYAAYIKSTVQVEFEGSMEKAAAAYAQWDRNIQTMVQEEFEKNEALTVVTKDNPVRRSLDVDSWLLPLVKDILENAPECYSEELKEMLRTTLANNHLLKDGKVQIRFSTEGIDKVLKNSTTKLNAIVDIIKSESSAMGNELRALVLMDNIRKEDISKVETEESLTDLGVSTVFERLRRQEHLGNLEKFFAIETESNPSASRVYRTRIGVLTGSLVILPDGVIQELMQELGQNIRVKPLGSTGYSTFESGSDVSDQIVTCITDYFCRGKIEILIGTAALLGEGWDAPAVNTLIIGSTSSTYVKTNQMRGRALRILSSNPEKESNIWHLMAVSDQLNDTTERSSMEQRFDTIVGISMDGRRVENGIARLSDGMHSMADTVGWNSWMLERSRDRQYYRRCWEYVPAVFRSSEVRNVVMPRISNQKKGFFAIRKGLSPGQQMQVASGTLNAMKYYKMVSPRCELKASVRENGSSFYLDNASEHESMLFANIIKQAFSPIVSPKYIVSYGLFFKKYVPVPKEFSGNQTLANQYRICLKANSNMIRTDTNDGKEKLLEIRLSPEYRNITRESATIIRELI